MNLVRVSGNEQSLLMFNNTGYVTFPILEVGAPDRISRK